MQDVHVKLNPGLPWQSSFLQEEGFFHQQIGLKNLRKKLAKLLHLEHSFVRCCSLDTSWSVSEIRWKFWNVVLGVGRRASVGPIVWKMKKCYIESRRKGTPYTQYKGGRPNWTGHISRSNCLLKHVIEGTLEGRIEVTVRRGRRRTQLPDDSKDSRWYLQLKQDALYVHNSLWKRLPNELRVVLDWLCRQEDKTNTTRSSCCPIQRQTVTALGNSGLCPCSNTARSHVLYLAGFPRRVKLTIPALVTGASNNLQTTAVLAASAALSRTIDTFPGAICR